MAIIVAGISVVQPYVLARSGMPVSCGADTTEDILATISIPAGALGINGWIRLTTAYTQTNNANAKTYRTRFSGLSGTVVSADNATAQAIFRRMYLMANRGVTNSQVWNSAGTNDEAGTGGLGIKGGIYALATTAVDTTVVSTIVITGQKAVSGDTLTLESYLVELFPTA